MTFQTKRHYVEQILLIRMKRTGFPKFVQRDNLLKKRKNVEFLVYMVVTVISQEKMKHSTCSNVVPFLHNVKAY
ncbi:hypothetical protein AKH05_11350 [Vibrio parahaemolyticus]|nr:hypothetical protein AKH05_11350 [Vibrio parahaemolyticus]